MSITNGYCTLNELKARLSITDSASDSILEQSIEAASRQIDNWTDRRFYATSATKYFSPTDSGVLMLDDDLLTVTTIDTDDNGLRTYGVSWAATDYDLDPLTGPPYTALSLPINGRWTFPRLARSVRINGSWGYSATTPDAIVEACLIQAARLFERRNAPFGVAGSSDALGTVATIPGGSRTGMDRDAEALIQPYRRVGVALV